MTSLWSDILTKDLNSQHNKVNFLAGRIADAIESGRLVDKEKLPSVRALMKATKFSNDTILKSFHLLAIGGYIVTEPGRGSYVNRNSLQEKGKQHRRESFGRQQADIPAIRFDQYCMSVSHLKVQSKFDKDFRELKSSYYEKEVASEQNRIVPELIHTMRILMNNRHKKAYTYDNIYYSHDFYSIFRVISKVIGNKKGVIVVPENCCISVRSAIESVGMEMVEAGMDEFGFRVEELAEICRHHKVAGVYLMSNANFPDTVDTTIDRLVVLIALHKEYGFTIIEDDRYTTWFKPETNRLLDFADIQQDDIIYLRPLSLLNERLGRLTILAATKRRILQISQLAVKDGLPADQSVANAANDILQNNLEQKAEKKMSSDISEVTTVAAEILLKSGLWMPQGVKKTMGMGFYLVPVKGRLPPDIYEILKAVHINVVDPKCYVTGSEIPGLRLSLGWYVGRKTLMQDLIKLNSILEKSLIRTAVAIEIEEID